MRGKLIGAALLAALAIGQVQAQAQAPAPKGPESVAEKELREKSGSMSEKLIRGEPIPDSDRLVGSIPDFEPIGQQLERVRQERERREVLSGKKGPIAQAIAGWEDREWPPLLYAVGTMLLWGVGVIVAIWLIGAIVGKFRQQ